jgi:hypothetical protein
VCDIARQLTKPNTLTASIISDVLDKLRPTRPRSAKLDHICLHIRLGDFAKVRQCLFLHETALIPA